MRQILAEPMDHAPDRKILTHLCPVFPKGGLVRGKQALEQFLCVEVAQEKAPVFPGETIVTSMWREADKILVRAATKERESAVITNSAITLNDKQ